MDLGQFDTKVLRKLNKWLQNVPIAPIAAYHSVDAENFYFVRRGREEYNSGDEEVDDENDDFVDLEYNQYENMTPIPEWEVLSKKILFTGRIYTIIAPKSYNVGNSKSINAPDITTRAYRPDTEVSVVDVLRAVSYVAYDPMIEATDHAGIITNITIDKDAKVPTLIVEFKDV